METKLTGKGVYLWQIKKFSGPDEIAALAQKMGLSHVLLKVADGPNSYNMRPVLNGLTYVDDLVGPVVSALKNIGVLVYGWQYIYLNFPESEARKAIERVIKFDLDGFVINGETEVKNKPTQAARYMKVLKEGLAGTPIGFSSYRYPQLHPEVPWSVFLDGIDYNMPQVYWMKAHNPVEQLNMSVAQFETLYKKIGKSVPIIPTGSAFTEFGWTPTTIELDNFHQRARELAQEGRIEHADNWWDLINIKELNFVETISLHQWESEPSLPTPPIPLPTPQPPPAGIPVVGEVVASSLNIRTAPDSSKNNIIGHLKAGARPVIYETQSLLNKNEEWGKIGENLWIALRVQSTTLCKI